MSTTEPHERPINAGAIDLPAIRPGSRNAVDRVPQPAFPISNRKFGHPGPLGLLSFSTVTLISNLYNVSTRHIAIPNLIVATGIGFGGFVQLIAGMWAFAAGDTFGGTAFSSYGGFWIAYSLIFIPSLGIEQAYGGETKEFNDAVCIFLIAWTIFSFILFFATHKASWALTSTLFFLTIHLAVIAVGAGTGNAKIHKAGGYLGLIVALCGYWILVGHGRNIKLGLRRVFQGDDSDDEE